jgi:hypothetical protein
VPRQNQGQGQQLIVLSKVILHLRPEVRKTLGEKIEFQQVGLTQEGPFLKIIAAPGSNIEGARLYLFELIAGVETYPSKIEVSAVMPAKKPN